MNKSKINAKNQNHFDFFLLFKQSIIEIIHKAITIVVKATKKTNTKLPNFSTIPAKYILNYL